MLDIFIPGFEVYNEELNEFGFVKGEILHLEYSLIAISKWESKLKVPFFSHKKFTKSEFTYLVECMTTNKVKDRRIYSQLSPALFRQIQDYMADPYSATVIKKDPGPPNREVLTSELIYYWLVAGQIPFDPCEKWHLNRLFKLVEITGIKNQPPKKMGHKQLAKRNTALNASRLASLGTKG